MVRRATDRAVARDLDRLERRRLTEGLDARPAPARATTYVRALLPAAPVLLVAPVSVLGAAVLALLLPGIVTGFLAVMLLVLAYVSLPRDAPQRDVEARVPLTRAPETSRLLDEVCAEVGCPRPDELWLVPGSAGAVVRHGLRRRPAVVVGAETWAAAGPPGRVALVAHLGAHLGRRELRVARWTGRATGVLEEWWKVTGADHDLLSHEDMEDRKGNVLMLQILFWPLRILLRGASTVLDRAQAPLVARGELLADVDAARVAGRAGLLELLDVSLATGTVETALTRAVLTHADLQQTLRLAVTASSAEDRRRRREATRGSGARLDAGHPLTGDRLRLALALPDTVGSIDLSAGRLALVDAELQADLARTLKVSADRIRTVRQADPSRPTQAMLSWDRLL